MKSILSTLLLASSALTFFHSSDVEAAIMQCRPYTIVTTDIVNVGGVPTKLFSYSYGQHCDWVYGGNEGGSSSGGGRPPGEHEGGGTSTTTRPTENTCVANPILVSSGKKYQHTIDQKTSNGLLTLDRFYHQENELKGLLGHKWGFGFEHELNVSLNNDGSYSSASLVSANGNHITFYYYNDTDSWYTANGELTQFGFSSDSNRWIYQSKNKKSFNFNDKGQILSIVNNKQLGVFYTYNADNLLEVINSSTGDSLAFSYNNSELVQSVNFNGKQFEYKYNENALLQKLALADGNYYDFEYSDKRYPSALTGKRINGKPYANWAYSEDGRALYSEHADGAERTEFTYHENGSTTVKNELGKETTYHFTTINGKRLPTTMEGHEQGACHAANKSYTYDELGFQDKVTDWQGNVTDFDYNDRGLITKQTKAFNTSQAQTSEIIWHENQPLPLKTIDDNLTTEFTYDDNHRVVEKRVTSNQTGDSRVISYTYQLHDNGMLKERRVDGARAGIEDVTVTTFDNRGNTLNVTNPLGHEISFGDYDLFGNPGYQIDVNGIKTLFQYDEMGRVIKSIEKSAGKKVTRFEYNAMGQAVKKVNPNGGVTLYHYDDAYRKTGETNTLGHTATFDLDAAGNVINKRVSDDLSPWEFSNCHDGEPCNADISLQEHLYSTNIEKSFDGLSRITQVSRGGDVLGNYEYDANNNVVRATDADGKTTRFTYDALNRKVSTTADGETTAYTYNKQDLITSITDARGNVTDFEYDDFGQLIKKSSGDSGTTIYTYNTSGENTSKTRADGVTLYFDYDVLGRILQTSTDDKVINSYRYDNCKNGVGRLCVVKDSSSKTKYVYHQTGQLDKKIVKLDGVKYKTDYKFDRLGRVKSVTYPSGQKLFYSYDKLGNVLSINTENNVLIEDVKYKPYGPIKSWVFGNGQQRVVQYDNQLRIKRILATGIQDLSYQYDLSGNINSLVNNRYGKVYNYSYNALNRLTAIGGNEFANFEYDGLGNRLSSDTFFKSKQYRIAGDSNRLLSVFDGHNNRRFKYDANGNIIRDKSKMSDKHFKYNAENRMRAVVVNGKKTTYQYNAHGKRVSKTLANGNTFHYIYDAAGQLIAESKNGRIKKEYVYLNGNLIGLFVKNKLHYVHTDHLGRPEIVSDSHQNTVWRAENKAFDRKVRINKIGGLNIGFPGQYWDKEKQSWYNGFRDYDSTIGRYLQSDPIGTNGGINTYNYVLSNPVSLVDVLGLRPVGWQPDGGGPEDEFRGTSKKCSSLLTQKQKDALHKEKWEAAKSLILEVSSKFSTKAAFLNFLNTAKGAGSSAATLLKAALDYGIKDIDYYLQSGGTVHLPASYTSALLNWPAAQIDWNKYKENSSDSAEDILYNFFKIEGNAL